MYITLQACADARHWTTALWQSHHTKEENKEISRNCWMSSTTQGREIVQSFGKDQSHSSLFFLDRIEIKFFRPTRRRNLRILLSNRMGLSNRVTMFCRFHMHLSNAKAPIWSHCLAGQGLGEEKKNDAWFEQKPGRNPIIWDVYSLEWAGQPPSSPLNLIPFPLLSRSSLNYPVHKSASLARN